MRFLGIVLFSAVGLTSIACGGEDKNYGLKPLTDELRQYIHEFAPKIIHVNPNKIGAARICQHCEENNLKKPHPLIAENHEEEFVLQRGPFLTATNEEFTSGALPNSVNNSKLPSFPPIGNQDKLGSCVAWSTTYYQASHEIGLLNGYNNKTSQTHVLSPKWTYNLLNNGKDGGLWPTDAYKLLSQNGAVSYENFPYDNNYLAWDLVPQDWITALSARMGQYQLVSGAGSSPQNLRNIKQLLTNGHVLSLCTYVNSWVFTRVGSGSPHAGEVACSWVNGHRGGHCMTIVGYDDDVWIDINGNGTVDPGEKGAFLVANSWGSGWGNKGFVWIAYDAFNPVSTVRKGPSLNRVAAADPFDSYLISAVPISANYSPKLVAQFSLNQSSRNHLSLGLGLSNCSTTKPAKTFVSGALNFQGGSYGFNGVKSTTAQEATFALDFTDLLANVSASLGAQRYYLQIKDNLAGMPTILNSYALLDIANNRQLNHNTMPISCDKAIILPYIDFDFFNHAQAEPTQIITPNVKITHPLEGVKLKGTVSVNAAVSGKGSISKVEFYVDSALVNTDQTAPYMYYLKTKKLTNGVHTLKAIIYDTDNMTNSDSITVTVSN